MGDLATPDDFLMVGNPVALAEHGGIERLRNTYLAWEFSQHCDCKPPSIGQPPNMGPSGQVTGCDNGAAEGVVTWQSEPIPAGLTDITVMILGVASNNNVSLSSAAARITLAVPGDTVGQVGAQQVYWWPNDLTQVFQISAHHWDAPGLGGPMVLQYSSSGDPSSDLCVSFAWTASGMFSTSPAPPPPITGLPDDFPANPDCPTVDSLQGLGDLLCELKDLANVLNAKLDYLANRALPPMAIPDDEPIAAPATPLSKPKNALGVVIELTTIPAIHAHYGQPAFYPDVGHAVMLTADGALPSVLVKHNPMVLIFPNEFVTDVQLDLAAGVEGQIRWLRGPK